jgi:hypothetical protein
VIRLRSRIIYEPVALTILRRLNQVPSGVARGLPLPTRQQLASRLRHLHTPLPAARLAGTTHARSPAETATPTSCLRYVSSSLPASSTVASAIPAKTAIPLSFSTLPPCGSTRSPGKNGNLTHQLGSVAVYTCGRNGNIALSPAIRLTPQWPKRPSLPHPSPRVPCGTPHPAGRGAGGEVVCHLCGERTPASPMQHSASHW